MERFPNYSRLIRTMALVQQFIYNVRNKVDRNIDSSLNVEELRQVEESCLRFSQQESFAEELKYLEQDKPIPRDSQIFKLSQRVY